MKKGSSTQKPIWTTRMSDIVATHPCFDTKAHHHFGRIHLPVAPRCNIMCAYCNRRYDCPNESRPGLTSRVMTPNEALDWTEHQVAKEPRITVVGIAGPGDPLCNQETFKTLNLLKRRMPQLTLCLSTNGVLLASMVKKLADIGVTNVTITINAVDEAIGSKIYRLAFLDGKRLTNKRAAGLIIQRQLEGLSAAVENGLLVKVNTVLIPDINDTHMAKIAKAAKQRGAYMMNVLPLIPAGFLSHVSPPDPALLKTVRDKCGFYLPQMKHCHRCRADAVGLLKKERYQKKALNNSKLREGNYRVAVASKGNGIVNQHFGHARGFYIYDLIDSCTNYIEFRNVQPYCIGPENCLDKEADILLSVGQLTDCKALICASIGHLPKLTLEQAGIWVIETLESIEMALQKLVHDINAGITTSAERLRVIEQAQKHIDA